MIASLLGLHLAFAHQRVELYAPTKSRDAIHGQPYVRYLTRDKYGRVVSFYLSEAPAGFSGPLILFVQGSGWASLFGQNQGRSFPQGGHISLTEAAAGKARVLIVEKPGVSLYDTMSGDPPEPFAREFTLDRWAEALEAAVKAAQQLPGVSSGRVMAIGHSEGGLVACRVAHDLPFVTHVALVAGGGYSQMFDLLRLTRDGVFFSEIADPEARVTKLREEWKKALADPDSDSKRFLGLPYKRWTSFLSTSPAQELRGLPAKVMIVQGMADRAVDPASADALASELTLRGQNFTLVRIPDADHNLRTSSGQDLWPGQMGALIGWFLKN